MAALLLIWDLRRFGLSNPERLFSDIYLSLILLAGLFTLLLDRESLQKLKRMEADMEAAACDYEKLTELTAQREAAQGELDALYERWEQLSEEAGEA